MNLQVKVTRIYGYLDAHVVLARFFVVLISLSREMAVFACMCLVLCSKARSRLSNGLHRVGLGRRGGV